MPSKDPEYLDAVYFAATQERVIEVLDKARRSVRYARGEFESLKTHASQPSKYRKTYRQMADSLLRTEQAIQEAANENCVLQINSKVFRTFKHDTSVSPEVANAIRQTIEEINAAERRLVGHCESAKAPDPA